MSQLYVRGSDKVPSRDTTIERQVFPVPGSVHACGLYDNDAGHCGLAPMAVVLVLYFPGSMKALVLMACEEI